LGQISHYIRFLPKEVGLFLRIIAQVVELPGWATGLGNNILRRCKSARTQRTDVFPVTLTDSKFPVARVVNSEWPVARLARSLRSE